MQPCQRLTAAEIRVATLVWEGLTNRQIAGLIGTTEQVVKNYLANHIRQAGRVEPPGTCALRGGARERGVG